MSASLIFLLFAIIIVGVLIFVAINMTQKRGHVFDTQAYQSDWLIIENSLHQSSRSSYSMVIVEADKLLDKAMREMGISGNTMGERLKHSGSKFSHLNAVWAAHKLRNQIAHEPGFTPTYEQTKRALASFRQALKDLGAI